MDWRKIALTLCLFPVCALAQRTLQEQDYNTWLLEKPIAGTSLLTARIAGVASYGRFQSTATLAFSCGNGNSVVSVDLAVGTQQLAFDTDPYEGPSATTGGPVTVVSGSTPVVREMVSGFFGDGGAFDTGTPFIFSFRPETAQMRQWVADATRGQSLKLLVPAPKGGAPMTVMFRWPADNSAFKRVVMPCVDAAASKKH
jgi:hypothetical protein